MLVSAHHPASPNVENLLPAPVLPPDPTQPVFGECMQLLARVHVGVEGSPPCAWEFDPVDAAPFLEYYFGRGGRLVWLGDDRSIPATLVTSWRGASRVWSLTTEPTAAWAARSTSSPFRCDPKRCTSMTCAIRAASMDHS
jgi:hypothetical protein